MTRQRLLNEPFFLIAVDFLIWIIAAVVYTLAVHRTPFGLLLAGGGRTLKCACRVRPPIAGRGGRRSGPNRR
jgi:ribose/xylose/arabinose/galactoside ABC-type transport system permease subunit